MKKLILSSFLCLVFLIGGVLAYRHQTRTFSNEELIVALSKHIVKVDLLRSEKDFYIYKVAKVFKGDPNLVGKELKQKKPDDLQFRWKDEIDRHWPPRKILFVFAVNSFGEAETFADKNIFIRSFYHQNGFNSGLEDDYNRISKLINNEKGYFYKKPNLKNITEYEPFFRRWEEAKDIVLVKSLDEKQNIKKHLSASKVQILKVLKGDKKLLGRIAVFKYFFKDNPYLDIYSYPLTIDPDYFDETSKSSGTLKAEYPCEPISSLKKDRHYIIQIGSGSTWEDKDTLQLEKKFPQFSSLVECEVIEDDSPFFDLVLQSF